jgi:dolichol-phosphate mannosyltransferase
MRTALDEKLALVVPTLNEAGNIQRLLSEVSEVLSPLGVRYEILVVDDNSSDNTADLVLEYSQIDPHVRLLSRKDEKGLAGAVIHGWLHTDADLLGVIDADLQHPPSLLPGLLGAMADGADIAIVATLRKTDAGLESVRVAISRATTLATLPFQRRESE